MSERLSVCCLFLYWSSLALLALDKRSCQVCLQRWHHWGGGSRKKSWWHPQKYTGYNNVLVFFKQKQKQKVKWGYWISAVPQGVGRITMCCAARCLTTAVRWGVGQTSTCVVSVTCKDGDLHLFCFWSETAVRAYSSYSSFSLCSIQVTLNTLWGRPKQFT